LHQFVVQVESTFPGWGLSLSGSGGVQAMVQNKTAINKTDKWRMVEWRLFSRKQQK
jgi:hypothetical protein